VTALGSSRVMLQAVLTRFHPTWEDADSGEVDTLPNRWVVADYITARRTVPEIEQVFQLSLHEIMLTQLRSCLSKGPSFGALVAIVSSSLAFVVEHEVTSHDLREERVG
jgi:hypothetical protein